MSLVHAGNTDKESSASTGSLLGEIALPSNPSSASCAVHQQAPRDITQLDSKSVWGLYCMYAIVGIVYGFVQSYIQNPICLYVFGPTGEPGRATTQQCNVALSITTMPWSFKVFYGFLLDNVGLFGTRRKGWIIAGWGLALLALAMLTTLSGILVDNGNFAMYTILHMIVSFFYVFSDVAGDGMTIELSKFEPEETRGYILATGQMVRFTSSCFVNLFAILSMDGKSWYPAVQGKATNNTLLPFELSFMQVHLVLFTVCAALWVFMAMCISDPPRHPDARIGHHSVKESLHSIWSVLKSRVMICLILFSLGNTALAGMMNPGAQIISGIARPSVLQSSLGTFAGNLLFLIGVWIFRKFFMNKNWRITFVWTSMLLSLQHCFEIIVIYNAWGIGQNGWFYAFGSSILNIIQGISQVLTSLAVIEIAPAGYEASIYEFLTTMFNAGITLNANIQNIFMPIFKLNDITMQSYGEATKDEYKGRLAHATYFTISVNVAATLIFMWFQPKSKAQCKAWLEAESFRNWQVGTLCLVIGSSALVFMLTVSFLSIIPSTMCLRIAGGSGC